MQIAKPDHSSFTSVSKTHAENVQQTTTSHSKSIDNKNNQHLFLNNIRPEQAREFLLNHITRKLNALAYANPMALPDSRYASVNTQDVINKLKHNVQQLSEQHEPGEISAQLRLGFLETKEILAKSAKDYEQLELNINEIEKAISDFVESKN